MKTLYITLLGLSISGCVRDYGSSQQTYSKHVSADESYKHFDAVLEAKDIEGNAYPEVFYIIRNKDGTIRDTAWTVINGQRLEEMFHKKPVQKGIGVKTS